MPASAFTVWFTGLSGAGKSTLARGLSAYLDELSLNNRLLDGDELRRTVCRDLGFSKKDRDENIWRVSEIASELNRSEITAIVAVISPYEAARFEARRVCDRFIEVFVDCPLSTLIARDCKGLYHKALAEEIENFSGISDPYERPQNPEIYLNTGSQSEEETLNYLISGLQERGYLPKPRSDKRLVQISA